MTTLPLLMLARNEQAFSGSTVMVRSVPSRRTTRVLLSRFIPLKYSASPSLVVGGGLPFTETMVSPTLRPPASPGLPGAT